MVRTAQRRCIQDVDPPIASTRKDVLLTALGEHGRRNAECRHAGPWCRWGVRWRKPVLHCQCLCVEPEHCVGISARNVALAFRNRAEHLIVLCVGGNAAGPGKARAVGHEGDRLPAGRLHQGQVRPGRQDGRGKSCRVEGVGAAAPVDRCRVQRATRKVQARHIAARR